MLNERIDRLIAYGTLRSGDKTVQAVRSLPQSEAAVEKNFGNYLTALK